MRLSVTRSATGNSRDPGPRRALQLPLRAPEIPERDGHSREPIRAEAGTPMGPKFLVARRAGQLLFRRAMDAGSESNLEAGLMHVHDVLPFASEEDYTPRPRSLKPPAGARH